MASTLVWIIGFTGVAVFLLFGIVVWLQPKWLISHLRQRSSEALYSVETDKKLVALTIDDGPDTQYSPQILDLLDKYQSHATFFLITERIPGNEAVVRRMADEGHELGNHLTKDEPSIALSAQEFANELSKADEIISQFADVVWVRPGSGFYNQGMLDTIKKQDYRIALGSVYPHDPQIGVAWFSAKYVLWKAKPGSVIVLHDYKRRGERTVKALEIILPALVQRGYQVVTLSELEAVNGQ